MKTFWQKIKNKLSNALPNWTKSKTSDIQAEKTAPQLPLNKPAQEIAPPPPPLPPLPSAPSQQTTNLNTPKKTQNQAPISRTDMFSELLAKTKHKREAETPEAPVVNSAIQAPTKQAKKGVASQVQVNKPTPGIAPPPPLPSAPPKQTANLNTPKKTQNQAPISKTDMFSELLAKTKHKREAETPEASVVNSATPEQPKQANTETAPQVPVNNPAQGIAPPPPPPVNLQPETQKVSNHSDVLAQIRKSNGKNLSKDHANYTYIRIPKYNISDPKLEDVLAESMQSKTNIQSLNNPQVTKLLDNKNEQERLNILYSAFVDNNEALIKDLIFYKVNVDISDDDDWDTDVEGTNEEDQKSQDTTTNIFTDKQYNEVKKAALETAQRIGRGEDLNQLTSATSPSSTPPTIPEPEQASSATSSSSAPLASKVTELIDNSQTIALEKSNSAPGAIPPPPPIKSYATPHTKTFLDSIRNKDSKNLKPVVKISESFNTKNFTYLDENKSNLQDSTNPLAASVKTRRLSINGAKELKKEFKTLDDTAKLNKLYSYVINNDQAKIKAAINYDEEEKVFFTANLEKIAKDVLIVAKNNPKFAIQINKGLEYFANKAELDMSKIEKQPVSHAEQIKQQREAPSKPRTH